MKGSDYVATFLRDKVSNVFGLQGGAVVHIFDSCERIGPRPIYCHHEQAAGFAACGYARVRGFGACVVTTGPGATNALTPLLGAWQDSLPVMFISGQQRSQHLSYGLPVRQVGTQESRILEIVKPITKAANLALDAEHIEIALKHAYMKMVDGRPGPVWVDIPLDAQYGTHSY